MNHRKKTMFTFLLFLIFEGVLSEDPLPDVCSTCHHEATCDDKMDGSGKVCNCKYGFVGNGRSFCQDKDECQLGAKICGQHTTCHNTYGSYYCTCSAGYSPSNNMAVFIPNDGTSCQDIDECSTEGLCGDGAQCKNLEGTYECSCMLGYRVHNGAEPFHPPTDGASCKVVDCGQPVPMQFAMLLSVTVTTYGGVAMFMCDKGFVWQNGDNGSVCGANGLWTPLTMVCEDIDECSTEGLCGDGAQCKNLEGTYECSCMLGYRVHNGAEPFHPPTDGASCKVVDCGQPVPMQFAVLLSVTETTYGGVAMFMCDKGFVLQNGDNGSVCGANGLWTPLTMVCEVVDCGPPPGVPHARAVWSQGSRGGAEVRYHCNYGYHNVGGDNVSVCTAAGWWETPAVLCQETSCGRPPILESAERVWDGKSNPGSLAFYFCKEGFRNAGGQNESVCEENAQWSHPSLSCREVSCGDPATLPHTGQVWNGSSTPGSTVSYYCKLGFSYGGGHNNSVCTAEGLWTSVNISCQEVDCGVPPPLPHSIQLWDNVSTVGSQVVYRCNSGYRSVGQRNTSVCTDRGKWDGVSLLCQEISCGHPLFKANANMLWDGTSHVGSQVFYLCEEGFHTEGQRNLSVCGDDGRWEDIDLGCEEITCGPPPFLPHTRLRWDGSSGRGTVVLYECMGGFYRQSGTNSSTCSQSGQWANVSVECKAECGPAPHPAHSEVIYYNRSVVVHHCEHGYHSLGGSETSVCGDSGLWQEATLTCVEIRPPIDQLEVHGEKCLQWRADRKQEDPEVYQVTYSGSRDFQTSFHHRRRSFVSLKAKQLELCLDLLPLTNYSVSITALSSRFTATISTSTSLTAPPAPDVSYREFETPLPTLRLRRSADSLETISVYQVFVLPVEGAMLFDCSRPSLQHIAAQMELGRVGTDMNFTVGDGLYYGGVFNAPLENGRNYHVVLRAVRRWRTSSRSSCVLWAKVLGTSFVLRMASLCAAASVGLLAALSVAGYSLTWCLKKK